MTRQDNGLRPPEEWRILTTWLSQPWGGGGTTTIGAGLLRTDVSGPSTPQNFLVLDVISRRQASNSANGGCESGIGLCSLEVDTKTRSGTLGPVLSEETPERLARLACPLRPSSA